jgi:cysteine synthase
VTGVGKYLRDVESKARIYAVEPAQCPLLSQCKWGPHEIDGIAPGFVPPLLDLEILSGVVLVTDTEAREMRKRLLSEEGIPSSLLMACNVVAAIKVGLHYPELPCVVCVGE